MPENPAVEEPLMEDINREEGIHSTQVIVQEIGDATFLQFDDNMVNINDLAKYRKVYIANSKIMYVGNIIVSAILLLMSFFSKSVYMIIGGILAFVSSFGYFISLRMINQSYNYLLFICVIASFASCVLNVISGLYESSSSLSMMVLFLTFIYYIMISYIMGCATRLQTILKLVPPYLYYKLK